MILTKVDINKDIEEAFPDEFYGAFTFKQCMFAIAGFSLSSFVAVCLWHFLKIGIVECTYIAIPFMIPVCAMGFFEYQKQSPLKILRSLRYTRQTRRLLYESDEFDLYLDDRRENKEQEEEEGDDMIGDY